MTLPELLKLIRQRWWILIVCPLIAMGAAYAVSSSMPPMYVAEATVIIEHRVVGGGSDLASIQAAERRTQTFNQLVRTRSVLSPVIERYDLELSLGEFRERVSVSHTRDTQLLRIEVEDADPEFAAELANAIAIEFRDFVRETQSPILGENGSPIGETTGQVLEQIDQTRSQIDELEAIGELNEQQQAEREQLEQSLLQLEQILASLELAEQNLTAREGNVGSQVFIVESAAPSSSPVSPRTMMNTALAGMLGFLLGGGLIVGFAFIDDKVKTVEDARIAVGRPVIGTVPLQHMNANMERHHTERTMSGEIFRGIRTNLQFTMVDRSVKSLVVTSLQPEEGKTTVAANLAIVLAQGGQRVILVDADLRRPRVHTMFDRVRNDRGLSNLLLHSPAVVENVVQSTAIKNLKIVAAGPLPPNPPDLFGSARMKAIVGALENSADIVLYDSSPVAISDSLLLASLVDGVVMVVRSGKVGSGQLAEGVGALGQTGAAILGVVLNGVKRSDQETYKVYEQYYTLNTQDAPDASAGRFSRLARLFSRN